MNQAQAYSTITRHRSGASRFEERLWWVVVGAFCGFTWGFVAGRYFF